MVFLTAMNFVRTPGPDRFWKRRRILMMSAAFSGRKRNCYSVALNSVHRALQFSRLSRPLKKQDMAELWETRITAGCEEHGLPYKWFHRGLSVAGVQINRKVLADLAAWEPRTFKSLTEFAWNMVKRGKGPESKGLSDLAEPPSVVNIKGMAK